MKNTALREKWQETIKTVDLDFLKIIDLLYTNHNYNNIKSLDDLPSEILNILHESREQYKTGKTYTTEEVMSEVKKKYNI